MYGDVPGMLTDCWIPPVLEEMSLQPIFMVNMPVDTTDPRLELETVQEPDGNSPS